MSDAQALIFVAAVIIAVVLLRKPGTMAGLASRAWGFMSHWSDKT